MLRRFSASLMAKLNLKSFNQCNFFYFSGFELNGNPQGEIHQLVSLESKWLPGAYN